MTSSTRTARTAALLVAVAAVTLTAAGPSALAAPATASACSATWGSLAKTSAPMTTAPLTAVRAGRHDCYDRLVLDLGAGATAGYSVSYVASVRQDGSGAVVPLRGGARLAVVAHAPAYDASGTPTYVPADPRELVPVAGSRTFRQVAWAGTFEGYTTVGLGVRARLPFRVLVLPGPGAGSRLVVDVAHTW